MPGSSPLTTGVQQSADAVPLLRGERGERVDDGPNVLGERRGALLGREVDIQCYRVWSCGFVIIFRLVRWWLCCGVFGGRSRSIPYEQTLDSDRPAARRSRKKAVTPSTAHRSHRLT